MTSAITTGRRRLAVLVLGVALLATSAGPGEALYSAHDRVVSADPADTTPQVLDGKVMAILPIGGRVYVGGTFTQVQEAGADRPVLTRRGLFAFDAATGVVDPSFVADFDVNPAATDDRDADRAVEALAAAPDGGIFVGGSFGTLNGAPQRKLVRLDGATGGPDPGFDLSITSAVKDLVVVGNRLIVAGAFSEVAGEPRLGLAAIDLSTTPPRLDPDVRVAFTRPREGDTPRVETIAVTPDGATLVAGGNFLVADGQPRPQIALVDLVSHPARVLDWRTERFNAKTGSGDYRCAEAFDTHMRDIDMAPDGSYFVVVTTGGYSRGTLCDTASRWETAARGSDLQPTWVNYSGGDSFTGVAVTGAAVYVSGHMRWLNNPSPNGSGRDAEPGPGAVPREGIAALDPAKGLPLPWNPGRDRGEGAWALVSSPEGLWVGSDTDTIGGETHRKLAFFPLPGGAPPPPGAPAPAAPTGPNTAPAGTAGRKGYWMVGSDGRVYNFGAAAHLGDAAPGLGGVPAVDLEPTPSGNGYWIVDVLGRVYAFGDARPFGNADRSRLAGDEQVTSLSATRAGNGYWLLTSRGRALTFGDAGHLGDMAAVPLNGPVLDSIPTPSGNGYYMVAADGGIFAFGDARFFGSMGGKRLNAPVQSLVPDPDGTGYWLVASDGGVFAFQAPFRGSTGSIRLNKPMTGMVAYGDGYLMVAEDGGIFAFSDLPFSGSLGSNPPPNPMVSVAALDD